jgi:hypothetical protein
VGEGRRKNKGSQEGRETAHTCTGREEEGHRSLGMCRRRKEEGRKEREERDRRERVFLKGSFCVILVTFSDSTQNLQEIGGVFSP